VELTKHDKGDWYSLQPLGVQNVDQALHQHLTWPEEEEATFLDALQGLEASREYMCQFDTENNITVMGNKVENELYRLRA
jgi:hypothetical protein